MSLSLHLRLPSIVKVIFTLMLALCVSGAPRALAAAVAGGEPACGACCEGTPDPDGDPAADDDCSPLCAAGPCAKVMPSVPSVTAPWVTRFVQHMVPDAIDGRPADLVPDGHVGAVFHPPRA